MSAPCDHPSVNPCELAGDGVGEPRPLALWARVVFSVLVGVSVSSTILLLGLLLHGGGGAFAVFYAAATDVRHGGLPYQIASGPALNQVFPYLPWVAFAVLPLTYLPYPTALLCWITVSGALVLVWTRVLAQGFGWTRRWPLLVGVALSSVLWRCLLTGQIDAFALGLETVALLSAMRNRPVVSGACAVAAALLKPQVLWCLPVVLFIALRSERRGSPFAWGGLACAVLLLGIPAVVSFQLLPAWVRLVPHFASSVATIQPDLAGLPGLVRFAPASWNLRPGLSDPVTLAVVGLGLGVAGWLLRQAGRSPARALLSRETRLAWTVLLPFGVWVLVSPYSHTNDMLVLIPLLVLALGTDGREIRRPEAILVLAALVILPEFFLLVEGSNPIGPRSLSSVAVLALVSFAWSRSPWRLRPGFGAVPRPLARQPTAPPAPPPERP